MGYLVDLQADPLQNVGRAVDHGIEQIHHDRFSGHRGRAGPRQLVADHQEWARLVIAHGDQPVSGEDEGDRGGLRRIGVGLAHQRGRHVPRAVLDIEPAGDLDFLHLLAGGNRDADVMLDELVFLLIWD